MADQVIMIYGSTSGGASNNVANITVPFDGFLDGILHSMDAELNADGEEAFSQIAETAVEQTEVNDARGTLSTVGARCGLLTSGSIGTQVAVYTPVNKRVDSGILIYLHHKSTAGVDVKTRATLYFSRRRG